MFSSYCDVIVLDGKKDGWIPKNIGVIVGVVVLAGLVAVRWVARAKIGGNVPI